ncbi:extracellular solute-binding protein [Cryobacterium lactosi]|uniref:Extracellular solute-binding protein n=2 Tax=Cryobacterium lactosi TaxID=1259202 RepID=A0A4R9BVZ0_9MICO|nr:extracellular solute-binding protein [Cryobacterium lactosi]
MTACSSGGVSSGDALAAGPNGPAKASDCTNKIVEKGAPLVTVWAWYPNAATVVDNFNNSHTDVQVCWRNVGQGQAEYSKFQTAIAAKKGAPDVIMLEGDQLTSYEIQDSLVDISGLGWDDVKANFSEGAIKDVSAGDGVYAVPVDGGPMGMIYRTDIFDKYDIEVPTTWEEYAAAAQKMKDAGGPLFGDLASNTPAATLALQSQKGAIPFVYNYSEDPKTIGIELNDPASVDVLNYWADLSQKGLIGKQDQFTTDYISGFIKGDYATYIGAAWGPGYLTGAGVGQGEDAGRLAAAPLPQWDASNPVQVNWGGSTFAVTTQATDKKLSAQVALELYADQESVKDGWSKQVIFPLSKVGLEDPDFLEGGSAFFGGQLANKEIYVPAANAYTGATLPPFTAYYYAELQKQIAAINTSGRSGDEAAEALQKSVVKYAKSQGFTVTE